MQQTAESVTDSSNIRLVALDMDGTLLDGDGNPPRDFPDWVCSHPAIKTVIASGRQIHTLLDQFADIAPHLTFIADNGALVMEDGAVSNVTSMDLSAVRTCIDIFSPYDCTILLCGVESAWGLDSTEQAIREDLKQWYARRTYVPNFEQAMARDRIMKIALFFNGAAPADAPWAPLIPVGCRSVVSSDRWVDVMSDQVSKGNAIKVIQKHQGISPDQCMAFGDYLNDLELLKACTESYAMANAIDEAKQIAKHLAPANTEDGVMRVLRTF